MIISYVGADHKVATFGIVKYRIFVLGLFIIASENLVYFKVKRSKMKLKIRVAKAYLSKNMFR